MSEYNREGDAGLQVRTQGGFSRICIIDALASSDMKTGRELHEELQDLQYTYDNLALEHYPANTNLELFDALTKIRRRFETDLRVPLIHIEAHANEQGFDVGSDSFVTYGEVMPYLRQINILARHKLLCVFAGCKGIYSLFSSLDDLDQPAPFWAVHGPSTKLGAGTLMDGYKHFYRALLAGGDMNECLKVLKRVCQEEGVKYHTITSELLFLVVFRNYLLNECSPEKIDERARAIVAEARETQEGIDEAAALGLVEARLADPGEQTVLFERKKAHFFMHDRYPELKAQIDPSFDDMLSIQPPKKTEIAE